MWAPRLLLLDADELAQRRGARAGEGAFPARAPQWSTALPNDRRHHGRRHAGAMAGIMMGIIGGIAIMFMSGP
jgi:hypothetical protein